MDITIHIGRVHFLALFLLVVGLGTLSFATAYGTTVPATFGHTVGEIDTSGTFSQLKTDKLCINSVCETKWPKPKVTDYGSNAADNRNIGEHDVCFLSDVEEKFESGSRCVVAKSGKNWVLSGYNSDCAARCLDW